MTSVVQLARAHERNRQRDRQDFYGNIARCTIVQYSASRSKTDEPIETSFRLWARMGPRNHIIDGVHTVATW